MNLDEKIKALEKRFPTLDVMITESSKIIVHNKEFITNTLFTVEKFMELSLEEIEKVSHHGKNVEHITRVTGYFSKVNGWNKGKLEEFKDRYRVKITEEEVKNE